MNWRNNNGLVITQANYDRLPTVRKQDYVATYEEANFVDDYIYDYGITDDIDEDQE